MSDDAAQAPPPSTPYQMSPEDLAQVLASNMPAPGVPPGIPSTRGSLRRKLFVAVLVAAIGVGASVMSCIGQSFSYRQARALEGIEQHLKSLQESCAVPRGMPEAGR